MGMKSTEAAACRGKSQRNRQSMLHDDDYTDDLSCRCSRLKSSDHLWLCRLSRTRDWNRRQLHQHNCSLAHAFGGFEALYFCRLGAVTSIGKKTRNCSFSPSWIYARSGVKIIAIARLRFVQASKTQFITEPMSSSVFSSAPKEWHAVEQDISLAQAVPVAEAPPLSISIQISVQVTPNRHRENRYFELAVREHWRFSLRLLKSSRFQFRKEQLAFGNWNRL